LKVRILKAAAGRRTPKPLRGSLIRAGGALKCVPLRGIGDRVDVNICAMINIAKYDISFHQSIEEESK
jgi:hypothetical protein